MGTLYTEEGRPVNVPDHAVPIAEGRSDFTKWLFSFREQVIEPLRHIWRSDEFINGRWVNDGKIPPIMNDQGIMWSISYIDSYLNASTIVTNLDDNDIAFRMRHACRDIWNGLTYQHQKFNLDKINIPRIANEMESKLHFILKGAKDNGYRTFFTKTYSVQEVRQDINQGQNRGGFFSGLFGGNKNQNQQQGLF